MVEGVNNSNNNAGLYAAGAALIGGGAGAAAGWYSRPFLKDGAPTDSFLKKMDENIKAGLPDKTKELVENAEKSLQEILDVVENAKSFKELKSNMVNKLFKGATDADLESIKAGHSIVATFCGGEDTDLFGEIQKSESIDDMKKQIERALNQLSDGKTLAEVKNEFKTGYKELEREAGKSLFEKYWSNGKKAFENCGDDVGKAVKKAAKSIQGKYAAIYGAIGAGVLGLGTYLCCHGKKEAPQPKESVDTQV